LVCFTEKPPHFHARYAEHQAVVEIEPVRMIRGSLPRRARRLVLEWAELHKVELADNWQRAQNEQALERIEPVD
jgi:Domain of unknown function (DUF4160)